MAVSIDLANGREFAADQSGATAVVFALLLVPVIFIVGASLDYGRMTSFKSTMQKSLDGAVLAGAQELSRSNDKTKTRNTIVGFFSASSAAGNGVELDITVDQLHGKVSVEATTRFQTPFLSIVGHKDSEVKVSAAAIKAKRAVKPAGRQPTPSSAAPDGNGAPRLSESQISSLIDRVQEVCEHLARLGVGEHVPQCRSVYNGTFSQELRASLSSKSPSGKHVQDLLPAGVRLVN